MKENERPVVRRGLDVSRGSKVTEGMSLLTYLGLLASAGIATSFLAPGSCKPSLAYER